MDTRDDVIVDDYRRWQRDRAVVGGRTYTVATKPGLFAHGQGDPATLMLAEALTDVRGHVVVSMPCGSGLVGAVAALSGASRVFMADRHAVALAASEHTLAFNGATATVLRGHGAGVVPAGVMADTMTIRVVPERQVMLQLLHEARRLLRPGGRCYLAGGNHEGAKSAAQMMQRLLGSAKLLAQHSSHRMVVATQLDAPPPIRDDLLSPYLDATCFNRIETTLRGEPLTLFTRPGVFSWEHLDEATGILAELIDVRPGERVLDLGGGAGALGAVAARLSQTGAVRVLDVDTESVRCAEQTLAHADATNASAVVSDVAEAVLQERFDVVVANPPFHVGKHVDLAVPRQFIRDAHAVLDRGGRVLLVANRTLPYEAMLQEQFGAVHTVHDGRRFKVLGAERRT